MNIYAFIIFFAIIGNSANNIFEQTFVRLSDYSLRTNS